MGVTKRERMGIRNREPDNYRGEKKECTKKEENKEEKKTFATSDKVNCENGVGWTGKCLLSKLECKGDVGKGKRMEGFDPQLNQRYG